MAQEFLDQLLRIENTIQVDEHEAPTCMICLESYGKLNPSTGAVELQVRLPCNHSVGTVCIATWLRDNNNCPVCRTTFFPTQPRPYLEHVIMNVLTSGNNRRMGGRDETDPVEICDWLCEQLGLHYEVADVAQSMTVPMSRRLQGEVHLPECNAATCVYIAWHLLNPDDNVADFLADLTHSLQVSQDHIRSTYRHIQPNRMELIVPEILHILARSHMDGILAFLPTPDPANGANNQTSLNTANSAEIRERVLGDLEDIREELCETVGSAELSELIEDLAETILDTMDEQSELDDRSEQLRGGVCVFMACHLLGFDISYSDVARILGVSERLLREAYSHVFPRRNELIGPETTEEMGKSNLERVLGALPALNWPSL